MCLTDHYSAEVQITIGGQDQEAKISSYEDALAKIKDTTGVSDIQVSYLLLVIVGLMPYN